MAFDAGCRTLPGTLAVMSAVSTPQYQLDVYLPLGLSRRELDGAGRYTWFKIAPGCIWQFCIKHIFSMVHLHHKN